MRIKGYIRFIVCWGFISSGFSQGLDEKINNYFNELRDDFEVMASTPSGLYSIQGKRKFVSELKDKEYIHSFIATNSLGRVKNEVVRGLGSSYRYRSLASQAWFSKLKKTGQPYFGEYVKNKRRHLLWCFPIKPLNSQKTMEGVLVVKIDFLDCLKNFSGYMEEPFELDQEGNTLFKFQEFSNREIKRNKISFPGMDNLVLMWQENSISLNPAGFTQKEF